MCCCVCNKDYLTICSKESLCQPPPPQKKSIRKSKPDNFKKIAGSESDVQHITYHQVFNNSFQPTIVFTISNGKIILANKAACHFLGYSKKELLAKNKSAIFNTNAQNFKEMQKQRLDEGKVLARVSVLKKNGKWIPCEITSVVFTDELGIRQAITTIKDRRPGIQKQKYIDEYKEKIVDKNVALAKSKQKGIDVKNKKTVADNISLAKSKQKEIDINKEKIVSNNIALAKSKQKGIDIKNKKTVADNIALIKLKQKEIDIKKEKIVSDNIALARSKQRAIDKATNRRVAKDILIAKEESDVRLEENNEWIKYIAKASYDLMWDWNVATGAIYVGDSIEEIFGYKVQNNQVHFTDFLNCISPVEKKAVEKKLSSALASHAKRWNDSFLIMRSDGSSASTFSRASIVRDKTGKALRLIGATQDVSRQYELEKQLMEKNIIHENDNERLNLIGHLSFDIMWEWDLSKDQVFMGDGFEELLGYTQKAPKVKRHNWNNSLHPDDRLSTEKGLLDTLASPAIKWVHSYRLRRADGSFAKVIDRANIIRDPKGNALRMIGAMHDITRRKSLENKLRRQLSINEKLLAQFNKSFKLIFNSSSDVLFDADLLLNKVIISNGYEKQFGYKLNKYMAPADNWLSHVHPEDREALIRDYTDTLASDKIEWKYNYRFLRNDNSVATVVNNAIILRNTKGQAYRMIGSIQDLSTQKVLEERLEEEINTKEKQIAEAMEDAKGAERSEIGRELHDNVNQLLGASKLYLELAKRGNGDTKMHLSRSGEYTLSAIEAIRKLTRGLTSDTIRILGLRQAVEKAVSDTMEASPVKIFLNMKHFAELNMSNKFKLNVFRIVQEQLNNILKHAKASEVRIVLVQDKKSIGLTITDNGIGFQPAQKSNGIGIANIKNRAAAYNGKADFVSEPGLGCALNISFSAADPLLNEE